MKIFGVLGAGGFAREVMPLVKAMLADQSDIEIYFVDAVKAGTFIHGVSVIGDEEFLSREGEKYFNIAIADAVIREKLANKLFAAGAQAFNVISQNSINLSNNQIGEGAILCGFTTITADAIIGRFFHANIYSYVAHDCKIGNYVTFAPNVHCNGNVIIEDYAYIGTGVIIKQGTEEKPIVIGRGAIVGMGAVVTKSVSPYTTVVGNPAVPFSK